MFRPRRIYAVGDIHGHYDELMALYNKILVEGPFDPKLDLFILLGDLVDVGSDTKKVIEQCMQWDKEYNTPEEKHFIFLYGNHEDMLLDALNPMHPLFEDTTMWYYNGGEATLKSYLPEADEDTFIKAKVNPQDHINPEHVKWLSMLPYFYSTPDYFFVHAGLPNEPLPNIYARAQANDQKLFQDMIWIRNSFITSNFDWGRRVIFAHTSQPTLEPIVGWNKVGLNTMPRNKGKLTCMEIPNGRFFFQPKI